MSERYEPLFIRRYMQYTDDTEPHELLHKWVAIALIAACAERKLWVWYGSHRVPLHQYIMLSGPSGTRKTTAITYGVDLLVHTGVHISSDSITREALMLELQESLRESEIPGMSEPMQHNSMLALAPEFYSFFRTQDADFLKWLVGIYDGKEGTWTYRTKHSEPCVLVNPCLSLLGASTPEGLGDSIPASAIGSGFTARIHFVYVSRKRKSTPFPMSDPSLVALRNELIGMLNAVHQRCGEINWTSEAKEYYASWYKSFEPPADIDDTIRSWYNRYSNFVVRLAGLACLADASTHLRIRPRHIRWAQRSLDEIAAVMPNVFRTIGQSRIAAVQHLIIECLQNAGTRGISRGALYHRTCSDIEPQQFRSLLDELVAGGLATVERRDGTQYYKWCGASDTK